MMAAAAIPSQASTHKRICGILVIGCAAVQLKDGKAAAQRLSFLFRPFKRLGKCALLIVIINSSDLWSGRLEDRLPVKAPGDLEIKLSPGPCAPASSLPHHSKHSQQHVDCCSAQLGIACASCPGQQTRLRTALRGRQGWQDVCALRQVSCDLEEQHPPHVPTSRSPIPFPVCATVPYYATSLALGQRVRLTDAACLPA